jgi:preprotein translocase subunit SecG
LLYVLYALFFIACIVLVGSVLLQPGKTDAGALFTSNVSSAAFGPRGTASVLSKMTIVAASVFMVVAFLISLPALQGGASVLDSVAEEPAAPVTEAPAVVDSNTNTTVDSNTAPATDSNAAPAANTDAPTDPSRDELGQEAPANK